MGCDVGVALEGTVGRTVLVIVGAIDEGSSDGGDEGWIVNEGTRVEGEDGIIVVTIVGMLLLVGLIERGMVGIMLDVDDGELDVEG